MLLEGFILQVIYEGVINMKKKIAIILSVLLVVGLVFIGYNTFLKPEGTEGSKNVSIEVEIENEEVDIDENFEYDTDEEFLLGLIEENQEELGAVFQESDLGKMLVGMMGYEADEGRQEYFHILVDGEDATTGVSEIPLEDDGNYKFELRTY